MRTLDLAIITIGFLDGRYHQTVDTARCPASPRPCACGFSNGWTGRPPSGELPPSPTSSRHPRDHISFTRHGRIGPDDRWHIVEGSAPTAGFLLDWTFHITRLDESAFTMEAGILGRRLAVTDKRWQPNPRGLSGDRRDDRGHHRAGDPRAITHRVTRGADGVPRAGAAMQLRRSRKPPALPARALPPGGEPTKIVTQHLAGRQDRDPATSPRAHVLEVSVAIGRNCELHSISHGTFGRVAQYPVRPSAENRPQCASMPWVLDNGLPAASGKSGAMRTRLSHRSRSIGRSGSSPLSVAISARRCGVGGQVRKVEQGVTGSATS
jgi:hypothetical protein